MVLSHKKARLLLTSWNNRHIFWQLESDQSSDLFVEELKN